MAIDPLGAVNAGVNVATNAIPNAFSAVLPAPVQGFFGSAPDANPLFTGNQANQSALASKYATMRDYILALPEPIRNSLVQYDAQRVAQGSAPLSKEETLAVTRAAQGQDIGHSASSLNPLGNAITDLKSIVGSIPRLADPRTWLHELGAIPHIGEEMAKAQSHGANMLQALSQAPGIRLLPGSFLLGAATHPTELLKHPLFAALDALPAAKLAAEASPVAKEAARLAEEASAEGRYAQRVNPIRTVLTRKLDATGAVVPNKLGDVTAALGDTRVGDLAKRSWSPEVRDIVRSAGNQDNRILALRNGVIKPADEIEQAFVDSANLANKHGVLEPRRVELTRAMQLDDRGVLNHLPQNEQAFVDESRTIGQTYGNQLVSRGELGQVFNATTGKDEFYPRAQADKITTERTAAKEDVALAHTVRGLREEYLRPSGNLTADDLVQTATSAGQFTARSAQRDVLHATLRTADAYGYDVTGLRKSLYTAERKRLPLNAVGDEIASTLTAADPTAPRAQALEIVNTLRAHRQHTQANLLAEAIADKNTTRITKALKNIQLQSNASIVDRMPAGFVDDVRSLRDRYQWENRKGIKYNDSRVTRAETRLTRANAIAPAPARFSEVIGHEAARRTAEQVLARTASPTEVADLTQRVLDARWGTGEQGVELKQLYEGIHQDVVKSYGDLVQAGADPQFVHRVTRSKASGLSAPRVGPVPVSLTQAKERIADMSPSYDDVAVSLSQQGLEMLQRRGTENLLEFIERRGNLVDGQTLREQMFPHVDRAAASNVEQQIQDLINRHYTRFNPSAEGMTWGSANLDRYAQGEYYLTKPVAQALRDLNAAKGPFSAAIDPITHGFRVAVTGLSPRVQLYNILGNATMVMGEAGPGVFARMREARELTKTPELIDSEYLRNSIGGAKREFLDSDFSAARAQVAIGQRGAQILNSAPIARAGKVIHSFAEKMASMNGMVDDWYRTAAYLYGRDKALTKGMTHEAAVRAGEELMQKSMMDWGAYTPIERNVFKSVFPFYGFMQHAIRYTARYPFEHPLRAAVLGAFGRAEVADLQGQPMTALGNVPVGGQDAQGNQTSISLNPLNPFADVGNMFTVAGLLSATNPVISTALEQAGLVRGSADLYPTLRYDPETGRLGAETPNILTNLLYNTIPQSQLASTALGLNDEYNSRAEHDPTGANRSLVSAAGLPVLWRQQNAPQEAFKVELAKLKGFQSVRSAALKSGDYGEANAYPAFKSALQQYLDLPPDQLAKLSPPTQRAMSDQINAILQSSGNRTVSSTGGI